MSTPTKTPFTNILVANRGEIALRVMRSARAAGYRTVAVYSVADANARHVQAADRAVCIGGALPAQSYLNIEAILHAAHSSGADAVHPGYGFLAENAGFAQACRDAGLVFIGPSPEAIRAMGDKANAKRLMLAAGVPCVPGYQAEPGLRDEVEDAGQSAARLAAEAVRIGWPVMIKAVAGGGGRGMRLVTSAADFDAALCGAQSEALHAFGDATVILERAISEPRHIEIQVFADRHGNAVHLGERDCSVQRRHQKLIEEAPSPAVSAELRERMGATAVAAVKAIAYEGAGTLEFLLDREGRYYFMEMNTRLQVEHPVTEAITGLDLVAWQLQVAAGEPLPMAQHEVRFSGHAIEVRLCAEDAERGFVPQSGTLACWRAAPGLRVEHALASGSEIPPFYDSMIAKLVGHGATRDEARRRLLVGLQDTVALGVKTNQAFLARCLQHEVFARGEATTAFVGQHAASLLRRQPAEEARAAALAAVLLVETSAGAIERGAERRLPHSLPTRLRFEMDGQQQTTQVSLDDLGARRFRATLGEQHHGLQVVALAEDSVRVIVDGVMESAAWWRDGARLCFSWRGTAREVLDTTRAASAKQLAAGAADGTVRASMNGRVVAVAVRQGQRVEAGQPVLTLEAMKMEHLHVAPRTGTVTAVHAAVGEQVPTGRVLVEIEATERSAP
jgi:geranyl-CoA carboxylase alpha subunit